MCRTNNTADIHMSRLFWEGGDALGIYFAVTKTNQAGDKPRNVIHIYANPIHPEICPILSLGLYLLHHGVSVSDDGFLFPGSAQDRRFSCIWSDFLKVCAPALLLWHVYATTTTPPLH